MSYNKVVSVRNIPWQQRHLQRVTYSKNPKGMDSVQWILLRSGPSGILAAPQVRDSPIWIQPRGVFRINPLRPRQNARHFPDNIFKCIFLNENIQISIRISLNFVPQSPINIIPALVQIMAWRRPLSEPMMITLLTHIFVTRLQWVNPSRVARWAKTSP